MALKEIMNRNFGINLLLLIVLNILIKPIYIFGIDRQVQNTVGASEYGFYFAIFNLAYILQIFGDLGLQNYVHITFSKSPNLIKKYFPRLLVVKSLLFLCFCLLYFLVATFLGYQLNNEILYLVAFNQLLLGLFIFIKTGISANAFYKTDSLLSVLDKALMIILVGYLLYLKPNFEFQIIHFVLSQTVTITISIIVALILLKKQSTFQFVGIWKNFSSRYLYLVLKKSLPYASIILLMTLYTRMDAIMIERLLADGKVQSGIYAAAFRILEVCNMVGYLFTWLLLPMFAKLIKAGNPVNQLLRMGINLIWGVSIFLVGICFFFAEGIIHWLYFDSNAYWVLIFKIVMPIFLFISVIQIYGTLLTAQEKLKALNLIFAGGALFNLILNLILIPHWGAQGAAIASLITHFLVSLGLIFKAIQATTLRIHYILLLRILGFIGVIFLGGEFISTHFEIQTALLLFVLWIVLNLAWFWHAYLLQVFIAVRSMINGQK